MPCLLLFCLFGRLLWLHLCSWVVDFRQVVTSRNWHWLGHNLWHFCEIYPNLQLYGSVSINFSFYKSWVQQGFLKFLFDGLYVQSYVCAYEQTSVDAGWAMKVLSLLWTEAGSVVTLSAGWKCVSCGHICEDWRGKVGFCWTFSTALTGFWWTFSTALTISWYVCTVLWLLFPQYWDRTVN